MRRDWGGIFRVADLGCATGKITLLTADTIVRAVQSMYRSMEKETPEIEVYFNDLPSNDFNSLFRMMPPPKHDADADEEPLATISYFAAAVCGSYFRRLFPRQSLHFCHSSLSLHWLSQVPESVNDRSSPAWSGNCVYISSECKEEVGGAYLNQFNKDMTAFLGARAEEVVVGGRMLISLVGRKSGSHIMKAQDTLRDIAKHLEYAFEELFNEGLIEKEKWESFNIPLFSPNPEELKSIVEREGSFGIESDVRVMGGFPLHPITKVPESVNDRSSPAWSGNCVYISSECKEEVGGAYLNQFNKDMTAFLGARAEEVVVGGRMLISLVGRKSGSHIMKAQDTLRDIAKHLEYAFEELFNEGLIEKEKWESFNISWFGPNPEELKSIVEREGSFGIESDVRVMGGFPLYPITKVREGEEEMFGIIVANHYRAFLENIVKAHLRCEHLTNEFFSRIGKRACAKFPEYLLNEMDLLLTLLVRKGAYLKE